MFSRGNQYWAIVSDSWGFTVAPYAMIGVFIILVSVWLVRTRLRLGLWSWQIKPIMKVNLVDGSAPEVAIVESQTGFWKSSWQSFVEAI